MALPFDPPRPSGPWHDSQNTLYAVSPPLRVACGLFGIGRRIGAVENSGPAPSRLNSLDDDIELLVGKQSASALGKAGIAVPRTPLATTPRMAA